MAASQQPQGVSGVPGTMPPGGMSQSNLNSIVSVHRMVPCKLYVAHSSSVSLARDVVAKCGLVLYDLPAMSLLV